MQFLFFQSKNEIYECLIERLNKTSQYSQKESKNIMISAGETIENFFRFCAENKLNKESSLRFWLTDERLSKNRSHSNLSKLSRIREKLRLNFSINGQNYNGSFTKMVSEYNKVMSGLKNDISLAILSIAEDGHIASLSSPYSRYKRFSDKNVISISSKNFHPAKRLTLTPEFILSIDRVILLASNEKKFLTFFNLLLADQYPLNFDSLVNSKVEILVNKGN